MSQKNPKFSVKSTMYPKGHARSVDGPWKKTWEEAVIAFQAMLVSKNLSFKTVFRPGIAEEVDEKIAPCGDGKHYYKDRPDLDAQVKVRLEGLGINVSS